MKVTLKTLEQIEKLGLEGQNVARGYYKSLFDLVADKKDWKGPIKKDLDGAFLDADLDVLRHAIVYFTGNPDCSVTYGYDGRTIVVRSAGYRAGPCGG